MATPKLNLEEILLTDKLNSDFINKINGNMQKIDEQYGVLVDEILVRTDRETFEEALNSLDGMYKTDLATATAEDIVEGKTAFIGSGKVTGTYKPNLMKKINVTLTGASTTYTGYISGYGAGIDENGTLVIWAKSNSTAYENINFVAKSIQVGTTGSGFGYTAFGTGNPAGATFACTINGLKDYNTININLYASTSNSSYDYVTLEVTVTAS